MTADLTEQYLAAARDHGPRPSEIVAAAVPDLEDTMYMGRCLTRPVFLDSAEFGRLRDDLDNLHTALTGLPDRVFGGDIAAFARAVGLAEEQVQVVVRGRAKTASRMGRADLYRDATGFRLLEMNMGSNVGGLDNTALNEAMLRQPFIAGFVAEHRLVFEDTVAELAQTILIESEAPPGHRPFMAIADWPESYPALEGVLRKSAALFGALGIDAEACPVDALVYSDDRIRLGDRPVDIVYRLFMLEDVLTPQAHELLEPVLAAAERGQVHLFTPMDTELYGSKGALALLSDEANRDRFSAAELASLDRLVPWTRMLRPGPATVAGRQVDLESHVLANRDELVLKPTSEHGGHGVVLGWKVDDATWHETLATAIGGSYVVQQRIRPVPELFPTDDGLEPMTLNWGAFLVGRGFGGLWVRGTPDIEGGLTSIMVDATATCGFHQE